MFSAGAATAVITPPLGISMSGDFTGRLAERVVRDLLVRALVLDDGIAPLALVTLDLIIVPAAVTTAARELTAARTGIQPDRVLISATHTHTGPALWEAGKERPDPAYVASLPARIADAVAAAFERRRPARVAAGTAPTRGVCFNRRIRLADGRVTMNFMLKAAGIGPDDPTVVGPSGPIDPEVAALLVEGTDGAPIALWASIPSHHGDTDDDRAYSPDYFGAFADVVAGALGPGCVGLLTTGASGNINTIDLANPSGVPYGYARGRLVATVIAGAALNAVALARRDPAPSLDALRSPIAVRRRDVPEADLALARRILSAAERGEPLPPAAFSFVHGDPIPDGWIALFAAETLAVAAMPEATRSELQVLRVGDFALAGLPGEFFVEWGLALKARSPFPVTAVATMTNDHIGYVPTPAAMAEGGYETWTARSSWAVPETGAGVIDQVAERLTALYGKTVVSP